MGRASSAWVAIAAVAAIAAPTVQACSIAHQPFDQAQSIDGALHFVDFSGLLRVDGAIERTVAEGYFLSFAPTPSGLLVAGQDGLGAGCEGHEWLRLYRQDGALAWQDDGAARVFAHEDGPIVVRGRTLLQFRDGVLQETGRTLPDDDTYVVGITAEGEPVYSKADRLVVGPWSLPSFGWNPRVAHQDGVTAVLEVEAGPGDEQGRADGTVQVRLVKPDGTVASTAWPTEDAYRETGLAYADGLVAAAGGRAYRLAGGELSDLGVSDVVAVGADGERALVFTRSGYVVFEGGRATAAWQRADGAWMPAAAPTATVRPVGSASSSETSATATGGATDPGDRAQGIPAPAPGLALAALALGVGIRRRLHR